jgi:hypothetical protein
MYSFYDAPATTEMIGMLVGRRRIHVLSTEFIFELPPILSGRFGRLTSWQFVDH